MEGLKTYFSLNSDVFHDMFFFSLGRFICNCTSTRPKETHQEAAGIDSKRKAVRQQSNFIFFFPGGTGKEKHDNDVETKQISGAFRSKREKKKCRNMSTSNDLKQNENTKKEAWEKSGIAFTSVDRVEMVTYR